MNHYVIVVSAAPAGAPTPEQPEGVAQPQRAAVWSYKTARMAEAVAANQNGVEGVSAVTASDEEKEGVVIGLEKVDSKTLVLLYNTIRPEKPIKKFADRETALKRMKGVLEVLATPGEPVASTEVTSEDSTNQSEESEDMAAKKNGARKTGAKKTNSKATTEGAGRPSAFAGKVIRKVANENPRREGTHGYKSWELIKNGMTYEKYIEAGGRRQDLAWDLERGYVKLEKA